MNVELVSIETDQVFQSFDESSNVCEKVIDIILGLVDTQIIEHASRKNLVRGSCLVSRVMHIYL